MTSFAQTRIITRRGPLAIGDLIGLYRSRRALATLNAEALRDIGLTPADARAEARRAFWDVPHGWLRTAR